MGTGRFLVERNSPRCKPKSKEEVEEARREADLFEIANLQSEGYIAPIGAYLQKYYTHRGKYRKSYFRLVHRLPILPGGKRLIHISSPDSGKYQWAVSSLKRRDAILEMKFHCTDFCFLDEFKGMTHLNFF
jgi:hypothetical protein